MPEASWRALFPGQVKRLVGLRSSGWANKGPRGQPPRQGPELGRLMPTHGARRSPRAGCLRAWRLTKTEPEDGSRPVTLLKQLTEVRGRRGPRGRTPRSNTRPRKTLQRRRRNRRRGLVAEAPAMQPQRKQRPLAAQRPGAQRPSPLTASGKTPSHDARRVPESVGAPRG